jgi:hypothetical protein
MYHLDMFGPDIFVPFLVFSIPIIAIVGGITAGIVKTLGRQRLIELAQRERIAAIERGVDLSKLPPLPLVDVDSDPGNPYLSPFEHSRRRSQGLLIGGLITLAAGLGICFFFRLMVDGEKVWAVGIIPVAVGIALLLSAWIVHPKERERNAGSPPHAG